MELTTIARACGKQNVHHLEREDLVALTVEAAAMARVPLAGTELDPRRPAMKQSLNEAANGLAALVAEMDDKIDRALARHASDTKGD
jgi:hypothetical protein